MLMRLIAALLLAVNCSVADGIDFGTTEQLLLVGGHGGYGFGLSDNFKKRTANFETFTITEQNKLGIDFGAMIYYGIGGNFMIGATADFQRIEYKREDKQSGSQEVVKLSETDTWMAFNASVLYLLHPIGRITPCIEVGPGLYFDPDDRTGGLAGGIGVVYETKSALLIDAGARIHVLLADNVVTYMQLHAGIAFCFGAFRP